MDETRSSLLGDENMHGILDQNTPGTANTSDNLIIYMRHLL
jgi:hypothetical protein